MRHTRSAWSVTGSLCGTEHLRQSPGRGLGAREEEPRRRSMMEWIFGQRRPDEYSRKEDGVIWIWILASLIGRLFAQLGGKTQKIPWLFAFVRRVEEGHYWAWKPRSATLIRKPDIVRHDGNIGVFGRRNPPCNAEDYIRAGLIVIEAWFGGY